jgi:flagellin
MSFSILNNIPSLAAQNQLSMTSASLQKTLFRLSSGSRINSGADDAAGLAIADGLAANSTALTQSARNATDGIGKLQVADGALGQVTTLLNRAVTLATEAATGTVSSSQRDALDAEFTQIKAEIDRVGSKTTFNGDLVFQGTGTVNDTNTYASASTGLTLASAVTTGKQISITDTNTGNTFSYTFAAGDTVGTVISQIQAAAGDPSGANYVNVTASLDSTGALQVKDANGDHSIIVSTDDAAVLGSMAAATAPAGGSVSVFLSDGKTNSTLTTNIGQLSSSSLSLSGLTLSGADGTNATAALTAINTAIGSVASARGTIGANINRLQSASTIISNQVQNLTAAEDNIRSADIAQEVANMTKFNILQSTGMAALSQSNQMQQSVLQLLR